LAHRLLLALELLLGLWNAKGLLARLLNARALVLLKRV
jgi:hypothetical protein